MDLLKQGIPTPASCLKTFPGLSRLSPAHLGKQKGESSFPTKTDISISLSDWSRDSIAPTHNRCGKLNSDHMRSELGLKRIQNFIMSDTEELNVGDFDPSTYQACSA